jgi:hypothetical protein
LLGGGRHRHQQRGKKNDREGAHIVQKSNTAAIQISQFHG